MKSTSTQEVYNLKVKDSCAMYDILQPNSRKQIPLSPVVDNIKGIFTNIMITSLYGGGIWYQMILCQRYQNLISVRHVSKK